MKSLLMLLALGSVSAYATEKCDIRLQTKESKWHNSQYDSDKYCSQYKQVGCKTYDRGQGRWESLIDFDEVFGASNDDNDFKAARTEAYRVYFRAVESRGFYRMPFVFNLTFDCKNKY